MPAHRVPIEARIRRLTRPDVNGCWVWTGSRHKEGYGQITVRGADGPRRALAHRVSYEAHVGPIPAGLQIDHLCRNRACVNPAHLEPVTPRENVMRSPIALAFQNASKVACPAGHPYSEANTYVHVGRRKTSRICRACQSASSARYRARQAVSA